MFERKKFIIFLRAHTHTHLSTIHKASVIINTTATATITTGSISHWLVVIVPNIT